MTLSLTVRCSACKGAGRLTHEGGYDVIVMDCAKCGGSGWLLINRPQLIDRALADVVVVPARNGVPGWTMYYFMASAAETPRLPIGGRFVVVYSPSPFTDSGWRCICYEIAMAKVRPKGGLERMYSQVARFELDAGEVAYFEQIPLGAAEPVV